MVTSCGLHGACADRVGASDVCLESRNSQETFLLELWFLVNLVHAAVPPQGDISCPLCLRVVEFGVRCPTMGASLAMREKIEHKTRGG